MALPINVGELIENRVVESTRIEYKSDWDALSFIKNSVIEEYVTKLPDQERTEKNNRICFQTFGIY